MKKIKYQVMRVTEHGMLAIVVPVRQTTFDNEFDAKALAYELSTVCKEHYIVKKIFQTLPA